MAYSTKHPRAFAQFFSEVNNEEFKQKQDLFELCHGIVEHIQVIFFEEKPGNSGKCATELKSDTNFAKIVSYNFSDYAGTKNSLQRQLLVTVRLE